MANVQFLMCHVLDIGLLWDLFFGVNGGLLGGYLFDLLNISLGSIVGQLVTAVMGAVIVLWIASFFRK